MDFSLPIESRIVGEIGFLESAIIALDKLEKNAKFEQERISQDLENWPSGKGRRRNQAAYSVALELAATYEKVTGEMPTYAEGTSGLSGQYTPSLRSVFDCLGLKGTGLRKPAQSAIESIKPTDLKHERNAGLHRFVTGPSN